MTGTMATNLSLMLFIVLTVGSAQVFLSAGSNNDDPFRSSWSDEFDTFNQAEARGNNAAGSESNSSSRRPASGPGSHDMADVCTRRCRCHGDRLEIVECTHQEDFGSLQDEFLCPNRIENLTLYNVTFRLSRVGVPIRLDANNFTDFRQLTSLRIIDSTSINVINYSAFLPSRSRLRHIEITNSRLQRIESGAFAYLDLDTLDVSNNRLYYHQKISPGTFQDARAIRSLILRNTSLSALPTAVLAPIAASLGALDISYNRLHTLSSDLIPVFCQLGRLSMNNNTWCCAKPGRWLSLFLRLTLDQLPDKIVGSFPPSCDGGPRPLRGRPISDVSYEEMDKYETCEGLLGPRDPKTCQELLAKFHEMFAAEHSKDMMAQQHMQQQQQQQQLSVNNVTPARNDRNRQRTSTPSAYNNNNIKLTGTTTLAQAESAGHFSDNNYEDEEEERNQIIIAGGSKTQQAVVEEDDEEEDTNRQDGVVHRDDNVDEQDQHGEWGTGSGRRRGALTGSNLPPLSCGFVECVHIIYGVIGTVAFIALVGAGIAIYTMVIRRWRNRSRHHLVERITS